MEAVVGERESVCVCVCVCSSASCNGSLWNILANYTTSYWICTTHQLLELSRISTITGGGMVGEREAGNTFLGTNFSRSPCQCLVVLSLIMSLDSLSVQEVLLTHTAKVEASISSTLTFLKGTTWASGNSKTYLRVLFNFPKIILSF